MTTALSLLAIALYVLTGTLLAVRLFRPTASFEKGGLILLGLAAVALHGVVLARTVPVEEGLRLGFANSASLIGGLIALLLLLSALIRPIENLGIVILPLGALALGLATFRPGYRIMPMVPGLEVHVLLSVFAYAILSIAALQSLLLLVQESHLRNKHPGGFVRALPPMQTMEELLFQMIGLGFVLLTLALVSGFAFLNDMFAQHLAHKTLLSILAWAVFGTLLWGRRVLGWRGRTAVRWTLVGFVSLMLAYFGTKLVLEVILRRA
jgi:ABC-type uncharacterized transport system permease subunit